MSESTNESQRDPIRAAYQDGRRIGLATAALALSVVSFLNLLGMEKSILAIVLAVMAVQGAEPLSAAFRRGRIAFAVAAIHVITILTLLVVLRDKIVDLVHLLQKLN